MEPWSTSTGVNITRPTPPSLLMPVADEIATAGSSSTDAPQEVVRSSSQSPNHLPKPDEPITGPELWEKRRAEWLAAGHQPSPPSEDDNGPGSRARARLEVLLAPNLAEEDDLVWNDTVGAIWKGLSRGDKLKRNLPLSIVIKILRGGWLRDGTWPKGMVAPEDEHGMGVPEPNRPQKPPNSFPK